MRTLQSSLVYTCVAVVIFYNFNAYVISWSDSDRQSTQKFIQPASGLEVSRENKTKPSHARFMLNFSEKQNNSKEQKGKQNVWITMGESL